MASCGKGPGYATPLDAMAHGGRERLLYVTCARAKQEGADAAAPDLLATVDVDPKSDTCCQIVSTVALRAGDEVHHSGWNACSSCFGDACARRSHIILPCLNSSTVYVVDTACERQPKIHKIIEPSELSALDASFPHTTHCLADGNIMISLLGDKEGNNKGGFILLDSKTFELKGRWEKCEPPPFGYDYWYQPHHNVMISTEWGAPTAIKAGFGADDVAAAKYGHSLHVWNWRTHKLAHTIELDPVKGSMPLEVRFKHNPKSTDAFVGCALGSTVYHIYQESASTGGECIGKWSAKPIVEVAPMAVTGWPVSDKLPALITDIILSLDDRYLYVSLWLHGEIRQYDVSEPSKPILTGVVKISGMCAKGGLATPANGEQRAGLVIKGKRVEGGPQMLQLSLDGKRLYVTTSLYTKWDDQFYPNMTKSGSCLLLVDIEHPHRGGMRLNDSFIVDFGAMPDGGGAAMAHEMRYPGGDCSSDIWLADTECHARTH